MAGACCQPCPASARPVERRARTPPHRLLEAAAEAFADRGFHATTTRDIASRAGLSPAGVYVHFASKEELLYQLSREGHVAARDMLRAAADGAASPTEALRAIMGRFATWHAEHFRVARIVQYEFAQPHPRAPRRRPRPAQADRRRRRATS